MGYSIEPRDTRYVKLHLLLGILTKNISNKCSQKLVDSAKKSETDAIETASKTAIQKSAEETGDLIGNKIADKITSSSKKSHKEFPSNGANNEIPKEKYISPQERQQIIDELRLI